MSLLTRPFSSEFPKHQESGPGKWLSLPFHKRIPWLSPERRAFSPMLWNVLIDEIVRTCFNFPRDIVVTDDIVLIVHHPFSKIEAENLQVMCSIVSALNAISST